MNDNTLLRIEEAGLNALQTQRQLFYDGWLLRISPGKAKRGRSVNAYFASTLPVQDKIDHCEALYASYGLPMLFRITPFDHPPELDQALAARGYVVFQPTLVQRTALAASVKAAEGSEIEIVAPPITDFVDEVAALRRSTSEQRAAHLERLAATPLTMRVLLARQGGRTVACGQVALDRGLAGIYDMVTDEAVRGHGVATRLVSALLTWAQQQGASHAFLQVDADNAPALAVYRKFGFATVYTYHYRARSDECR